MPRTVIWNLHHAPNGRVLGRALPASGRPSVDVGIRHMFAHRAPDRALIGPDDLSQLDGCSAIGVLSQVFADAWDVWALHCFGSNFPHQASESTTGNTVEHSTTVTSSSSDHSNGVIVGGLNRHSTLNRMPYPPLRWSRTWALENLQSMHFMIVSTKSYPQATKPPGHVRIPAGQPDTDRTYVRAGHVRIPVSRAHEVSVSG